MNSSQDKAGGKKGGGLGPVLLPTNGVRKAGTPVIHDKPPGGKRPRQETPSPQKERTGTDWHGRIADDTAWIKGQIGTAALGLKSDRITSLADSVREFFNNTLVSIFERQASTASDMCSEITNLSEENSRLKSLAAKQGENIEMVKACKDKVEVKASRKEMEEKVRFATTQVKITNLDLGKLTEDRREAVNLAKEAMAKKVRSDLKKEYDERIRHATIKILSGKTFKAQVEGKEVWTAPVLVTVPDRDNRWAIESILRKSKVFPSFHWPKEMMDPVKIFRKEVKDMGFAENTHFIRIRPEEREGTMRIRADVKEKNSDSRFTPVASFEIPPIEDCLKKSVSGWEKPVWKRATRRAEEDESDNMEEQEEVEPLTMDDIINNL
jgi:hypothetical protein